MSPRARFEGPNGCGPRTVLLVAGLTVGTTIAVLAIPHLAAWTSLRLFSQLGEH